MTFRTVWNSARLCGSGPGFDAALAFYEKSGFVYCGPFADYGDNPFSRFMTLELT